MKRKPRYKMWAAIIGVIIILLELLLLVGVTTTCCNPIPSTQLTADWLMPFTNKDVEVYLQQTSTASYKIYQLQTARAVSTLLGHSYMGTFTPTPTS
ncbi:MAG: hypothetical protein GC179_28975 [Anaerolineaceae bacterium]|nr:hypothetical protein [Anaerolineaceae bacterium]